MTKRTARPTREAQKPTHEQSIDEMVEESFPASDASQLPGRAAGAPEAGPVSAREPKGTPREFTPGTPRTIGNQGVIPASRKREETVPLTGSGVVTLRYDAASRRVQLYFSEEGIALDAEALDRLIAALSAQRAQIAD
jgi:hypothetical protein